MRMRILGEDEDEDEDLDNGTGVSAGPDVLLLWMLLQTTLHISGSNHICIIFLLYEW